MSSQLQQFTTGAEAKAWMARVEAEHARITGSDPVQAWRQSLLNFGLGPIYEEARSKWRLADALLAQMPLTDADRAEAFLAPRRTRSLVSSRLTR